MQNTTEHSPLGKNTEYINRYQADLLYPIARQQNRQQLGIKETLPFYGEDIWNAYEISWLDLQGKPMAAIGQFILPCQSPKLVESKSIKLYLNSLNGTPFKDIKTVQHTMQTDLSKAADANIKIILTPLITAPTINLQKPSGICLDKINVAIDCYKVNPSYLQTGSNLISEQVYSFLLKSNCPVTGQPDWGTVIIDYSGKQIEHSGLLKYIVSFREHNEFHEQCVERMFMDINQHCQPETLTISAHYTRRGGLDINPWRSTKPNPSILRTRLLRQ